MLNKLTSAVRSLAIVALGFSLTAAIARPVSAQGTQTDARWQAWLGCWEPAGTLIRVVGRTDNAVVCVVPGSTPTSVELITISGGKILDRNVVDADGQHHPLTKEGCTGWESASWSNTSRRVYLKSELDCKGAPATKLSALYAMAGSGEWIDVQGMRVDKNIGVHSVRYREAADPGKLPDEVEQKLQARSMSMAKRAAMLAVSEPPALADVEEASRALDPEVVSTWLIESDKLAVQKQKPLNAKQLEQLADNGVPSSVIDIMVGLSYPEVLSVSETGAGVTRQSGDSAYSRYNGPGSFGYNPVIAFDRFGFPVYASESALLYGCSPWMGGLYDYNLGCGAYGYGAYGYGAYGYGAYGYGGYGYPGYFGYGGYPYYGGIPGYYGGPYVTPVGNGSNGTAPNHGKVVNGHGYTQGSGGGSGTTAQPRSTGGGSPSGGAAMSPPPSSSSGGRTAEPKKP